MHGTTYLDFCKFVEELDGKVYDKQTNAYSIYYKGLSPFHEKSEAQIVPSKPSRQYENKLFYPGFGDEILQPGNKSMVQYLHKTMQSTYLP